MSDKLNPEELLGELLGSGDSKGDDDDHDVKKEHVVFLSDDHYVKFTVRKLEDLGKDNHAIGMIKRNQKAASWLTDEDVLANVNRLLGMVKDGFFPLMTKFTNDCCFTCYDANEELAVTLKMGFFNEGLDGPQTVRNYVNAHQVNYPAKTKNELVNELVYGLIGTANDYTGWFAKLPVAELGSPGWNAPREKMNKVLLEVNARWNRVVGTPGGSDPLYKSSMLAAIYGLTSGYSLELTGEAKSAIAAIEYTLPVVASSVTAMNKVHEEVVSDYRPNHGLISVVENFANMAISGLNGLEEHLIPINAYLTFKGFPTI